MSATREKISTAARTLSDRRHPIIAAMDSIAAGIPPSLPPAYETIGRFHGSAPMGSGEAFVHPAPALSVAARALTASGNAALVAGNFIEDYSGSLRGVSVAADLGANVYYTPVGDVPGIPFFDTAASAGWIDSDLAPAPTSQPTISLVRAKPKTVAATVNVGRTLLNQSTAQGELALMKEYDKALWRAIDAAAISGTGVAMPTGLLNTAGIDARSGTSLSYAATMGFVAELISRGVRLDQLSILMGATAWRILSTRERAAGSGYVIEDGRLGGIPVQVSAECPPEAAVIGDFKRLGIVVHGGVELVIDPFTRAAFSAQRWTIRADVDVLVTGPKAFFKIQTIT